MSLVAVIGFHAPINATGRRESKFRLGVMTLLSLSVMLLMLVDEMKFALESIPGQRGSFSDVPLIGWLIFEIGVSIEFWGLYEMFIKTGQHLLYTTFMSLLFFIVLAFLFLFAFVFLG